MTTLEQIRAKLLRNVKPNNPGIFAFDELASFIPIDFWVGWMTIDQFIDSFDEDGPFYEYSPSDLAQSFERSITAVFNTARKIGWEGDFRQGPYIAPVIDGTNGSTRVLMAWKQDNNGTTFVAGPAGSLKRYFGHEVGHVTEIPLAPVD